MFFKVFNIYEEYELIGSDEEMRQLEEEDGRIELEEADDFLCVDEGRIELEKEDDFLYVDEGFDLILWDN